MENEKVLTMSNKENKVSVLDFIDKYNSLLTDGLKEEYLYSVVHKNEYIPYITKIVNADTIVAVAHNDNNGKLVHNSPKEYILYVITLIRLYTDLVFDQEDSMVLFDSMNKYNLITVIVDAIKNRNERDFKEFNTVLDMRKKDFMTDNQIVRIDTTGIVDAVYSEILKGADFVLGEVLKMVQSPEFKDGMEKAIQMMQDTGN